jgi:hypothetical protein
MRPLLRWTEGNWAAPRATNRDGQMGNPHVKAWYSCFPCRRVAVRTDLD